MEKMTNFIDNKNLIRLVDCIMFFIVKNLSNLNAIWGLIYIICYYSIIFFLITLIKPIFCFSVVLVDAEQVVPRKAVVCFVFLHAHVYVVAWEPKILQYLHTEIIYYKGTFIISLRKVKQTRVR